MKKKTKIINKVWIIRWENFGDHTKDVLSKKYNNGNIIKIIPVQNKYNDNNFNKVVKSLEDIYTLQNLSLEEKFLFCKNIFSIPKIESYKNEDWFKLIIKNQKERENIYEKTKKYLQYIQIGHNPYLFAELVYDFEMKTDSENKNIFTYKRYNNEIKII